MFICYSCLRCSWEGMNIIITLSPVGVWPLQLVTDKVVLLLTWENVLIEDCLCLAVSPQPTGSQQIPCGLLSFLVWRPSLGAQYSLPVGQAGHPREVTLQEGPSPSEERSKFVATSFSSFFIRPWDNPKLFLRHLLGNAQWGWVQVVHTVTCSAIHPFLLNFLPSLTVFSEIILYPNPCFRVWFGGIQTETILKADHAGTARSIILSEGLYLSLEHSPLCIKSTGQDWVCKQDLWLRIRIQTELRLDLV